jgi:hypothetical protein
VRVSEGENRLRPSALCLPHPRGVASAASLTLPASERPALYDQSAGLCVASQGGVSATHKRAILAVRCAARSALGGKRRGKAVFVLPICAQPPVGQFDCGIPLFFKRYGSVQRSFRLDSSLNHDGPPLFDFGLLQGTEHFGHQLIAWWNLLAKIAEP